MTGGAGFIGTHTLVELLERNYDVVVVDNLVNSHVQSLERVRKITGKDFPFYQADVCDQAALDDIFSRHRVECVIHFAGLKAVGESCAKPLEYYRNNLDGMMSLLGAMRSHGVKRVVFSSSATVYRSDAGMPWTRIRPWAASTPTAGQSSWASRFCATWRRPIPSGRWCFCAISTPSARTPAA